MTYSYEVGKKLGRDLEKIKKKNKRLFELIIKKMQEILENPAHYKPLKRDLKGLRRVHIAKSFVLIFEVFEDREKVIFWDFDHHDKIYKKKFGR